MMGSEGDLSAGFAKGERLVNDDPEQGAQVFLTHPNPRELCSPQLRIFLKTYQEIFDFFFFGVRLATGADRVQLTAAKALARSGNAEDIARLKELEDKPDRTFSHLQEFSALQSENMTLRIVDNFTSYLSEIVQSAMIKRPEILRSKEKVKIEDVLRFSNFRDLISFLVNRKINEL